MLKVLQGLFHRRPYLLFVAFGQFSCHLKGTASSAVLLKFLEQRDQSVWCFVQHGGSAFVADGFEAGPSLLPLGRQKSFEAKASAGQSTAHKSSGGCAGAWNADHRMAGLVRSGHQFFTRVADAR